MTEAQIEALVYVVSCARPVRGEEVGVALGPRGPTTPWKDYEIGRRIMKPLVDAGAVSKVYGGLYRATEKGRIACALALAKRPGMAECFFDDFDA